MAKRPRNPWRRLNGSFRLGDRKAIDVNRDEQRITLYLPAYILDWAEDQAGKAGAPTVQEYCTRLLLDAIEDVRGRDRVAETEAKRGSLVGFHAITEDPEYLAEWSASVSPFPSPREKVEINVIEGIPSAKQADAMPAEPSPAAQVVLRHAAAGTDDPSGFLAAIRRGEAVPEVVVRELLQALNALENEYQDAPTIDRRVAYALHRLAFESQVLHTDAWPGALDEETVKFLRVVQEAVDRVLSGEDIRYYPAGS